MLSDLARKVSLIRDAFRKKDAVRLGKITHELIEEAVFASDKMAAQLSLISYALKKLLSKRHITDSDKWPKIQERILINLDALIEAIRFGNMKKVKLIIQKIMTQTIELDSRIGNYVVNLIEKAKLKQASTAYALGLSLTSAAELTDADKEELQSYIGGTKIHDEQAGEKKIIERVNQLKKFLESE
ncbi:MAG: hypothetical protein ABIA76_02870 [Candidatus Diapherotrites archaeon]